MFTGSYSDSQGNSAIFTVETCKCIKETLYIIFIGNWKIPTRIRCNLQDCKWFTLNPCNSTVKTLFVRLKNKTTQSPCTALHCSTLQKPCQRFKNNPDYMSTNISALAYMSYMTPAFI